MARAELNSWASLVVLGAVYWWFQMRMLDGGAIVDQPATRLFWIYLVTIAMATVAEIAIAAALAASRGKAVEKDERDLAIELKSGRNERFFVIAAVNVVIWQALMEGLMEGHKLPKIDLAHLPTLFFVLLSILFAGEFVRRVSIIWLYRNLGARA